MHQRTGGAPRCIVCGVHGTCAAWRLLPREWTNGWMSGSSYKAPQAAAHAYLSDIRWEGQL